MNRDRHPAFTHRESPPINAGGDRLLLRGEPGPIEKIVQVRRHRARVQAEERILTFLERVPGLVEGLDRERLRLVVRLVRGLVVRSIQEDRARLREVLARIAEYMPEDLVLPDPRDGKQVAELGVVPRPDPLLKDAEPRTMDWSRPRRTPAAKEARR